MNDIVRSLNDPTPFTILIKNLPFNFSKERLVDMVSSVAFPTFCGVYPRHGIGVLSFRTRREADTAMFHVKSSNSYVQVNWADKMSIVELLEDSNPNMGQDVEPERYRRDYDYRFGEHVQQMGHQKWPKRQEENEDDRRFKRKRDEGERMHKRDNPLAKFADDYVAARGGAPRLLRHILSFASDEYPSIRDSPPPVDPDKIDVPTPAHGSYSFEHQSFAIDLT